MIVLHRRGTTEEWKQADLASKYNSEVLLKDGEFAVEELLDGSRKVKIGDGKTKFQDLPYIDERSEVLAKNNLQIVEASLLKKLANQDTAQSTQIKKIYTELLAEIADLVDDDILILEKVFSVENSFKGKTHLIEEKLSDVSTKLANLTSNYLKVDMSNNELYIDEDNKDSIIFYCGTASDI